MTVVRRCDQTEIGAAGGPLLNRRDAQVSRAVVLEATAPDITRAGRARVRRSDPPDGVQPHPFTRGPRPL